MKNGETFSHLTSVSTAKQTKGKGRFNRVWLDSQGDFLFSILIKKELSISDFSILNYLAPLSIAIFLKKIIPEVKIKFPNDIIISNKKLAGILVETSIDSNGFKYGVLGYGLNIETIPNIDKNGIHPTFLKKYTSESLELNSTIKEVKKNIEKLLNDTNFKDKIISSYNEFLSKNISYNFQFPNNEIKRFKIDYLDSEENIYVSNDKIKNFKLPKEVTYISDSEVLENDLS
jgi:BirA family biotin operon repressor/biotin-[acetyl-CoA-carboxylase] ligase